MTVLRLLRRFLRPERAGLALRPHREFEVGVALATVFAQAHDVIEHTLGANVSYADVQRGTIEAAFGLVNHERLIVTLEALDAQRTHVVVEAFYPAGLQRPARSQAVDVLADTLESRIRT